MQAASTVNPEASQAVARKSSAIAVVISRTGRATAAIPATEGGPPRSMKARRVRFGFIALARPATAKTPGEEEDPPEDESVDHAGSASSGWAWAEGILRTLQKWVTVY